MHVSMRYCMVHAWNENACIHGKAVAIVTLTLYLAFSLVPLATPHGPPVRTLSRKS